MCNDCCTTKYRRLRKLCCFRPNTHRVLHNEEDDCPPSRISSPRSKAHNEFGACSGGVIGCMNGNNVRRQGGPVDYSYDPVSYALNFEDDNKSSELLIKNFTARLPPSPLRQKSEKAEEAEPVLKRGIPVYS